MPKNRTVAFGGSSGRLGGNPWLGFMKRKQNMKNNSDISSSDAISMKALHSRGASQTNYDPYEPGHRLSPIRTNFFSNKKLPVVT